MPRAGAPQSGPATRFSLAQLAVVARHVKQSHCFHARKAASLLLHPAHEIRQSLHQRPSACVCHHAMSDAEVARQLQRFRALRLLTPAVPCLKKADCAAASIGTPPHPCKAARRPTKAAELLEGVTLVQPRLRKLGVGCTLSLRVVLQRRPEQTRDVTRPHRQRPAQHHLKLSEAPANFGQGMPRRTRGRCWHARPHMQKWDRIQEQRLLGLPLGGAKRAAKCRRVGGRPAMNDSDAAAQLVQTRVPEVISQALREPDARVKA